MYPQNMNIPPFITTSNISLQNIQSSLAKTEVSTQNELLNVEETKRKRLAS